MKMMTRISLLALMASAGTALAAEPLNAKLIMPGGRSWEGQVIGRDGDWLEFATGRTQAQPIRVGASTIEELQFDVQLDERALARFMEGRQFAEVIAALEKTLSAYAPYNDIRSNLTKYNALLMELYYRSYNFV